MSNSQRSLNFPCAFHPSEHISHFCHCKECMLPLCRQCLAIHHKEHVAMSTPPHTLDIQHILDRVTNDIHTQRDLLHKKAQLLGKLEKNAEETHKAALKRLESDRGEIVAHINKKFEEMAKGLLVGFEERMTYITHIQDKIETLDKTLQMAQGTFYKSKPMRTVIMWQAEQLGNLGLEFQVKLEKELLTPYKVQLLEIDPHKLEELMNRLTTDRLLQSSSTIELDQPNDYMHILSKVVESDIDARNQSAKRRSSRRDKNHSEEKDRERPLSDIKVNRAIEVLGSLDNQSHNLNPNLKLGWGNKTAKVFEVKEQFD